MGPFYCRVLRQATAYRQRWPSCTGQAHQPGTHHATTYIYAPTIWSSSSAGWTAMDPVHYLLTRASLQLFADGHNALAADVQQLARKWTPAIFNEMVNDSDPDLEGYDYG